MQKLKEKGEEAPVEEDDGGYKAATEEQFDIWINDEENAMNPRVSMNISLDMTGMDKQDRGMLSILESDEINNLNINIGLDPNRTNGLQSGAIIDISQFCISKINYPLEGGGSIKIEQLDFGNTKIAVAKKKTIQLTNIKATDLNMTLNKKKGQ